jgi:hypothetical protein
VSGVFSLWLVMYVLLPLIGFAIIAYVVIYAARRGWDKGRRASERQTRE